MSTAPQIAAPRKPCRILSLDGGGAKGFYTLGVLAQVEALLNKEPLCDHFDLVFGTSTGAIIAALLSIGYKVADIHNLYKQHVPSKTARSMSACVSRTRRTSRSATPATCSLSAQTFATSRPVISR